MRVALALAALSTLAAGARALASPCCGGSSASPTLITGDDRAQLSASLAQSEVVGDAPPSGLPVFRAPGDVEQAQTFKLDGAYLLSDRWQIGASVPIVRRSRSTPALSSAAAGFGDVVLSGAYELLPQWEYSVWKPRGYLFADGILPAGGSVYESSYDASDPWGLDARGRGFFALGVGSVWLKSWGGWDVALALEVHRAFARSFSTSGGSLTLTPGWGGMGSLGGGYSLRRVPLRFGVSLSPAYEEGIGAQADWIDQVSNPQLVWTAAAQIAWMCGASSALSAVYSDQTLVGPASNASLSRSVALLFQQRWER